MKYDCVQIRNYLLLSLAIIEEDNLHSKINLIEFVDALQKSPNAYFILFYTYRFWTIKADYFLLQSYFDIISFHTYQWLKQYHIHTLHL